MPRQTLETRPHTSPSLIWPDWMVKLCLWYIAFIESGAPVNNGSGKRNSWGQETLSYELQEFGSVCGGDPPASIPATCLPPPHRLPWIILSFQLQVKQLLLSSPQREARYQCSPASPLPPQEQKEGRTSPAYWSMTEHHSLVLPTPHLSQCGSHRPCSPQVISTLQSARMITQGPSCLSAHLTC